MYINTHYEPVLGPNTHQWWIYDEYEDVYIDPPVAVLDKVKEFSYPDGQEDYLYMILSCPEEYDISWLDDKDHWYTDIEI